MTPLKLEGKVAVITGAGSGIGRATALLFSNEGAKVVVFDVAKENGEETIRMIEKSGGEALSIPGDVSNAADVQRMVTETIKKFGRLDI
ncbi:SDR family NAD(P)-dependent oxidoreductase, partial [[Eubacterium] cellulosolvens]